MSSTFAAAMDKIVADCNDRLLWVPFSKDQLTKEAARVLIQRFSLSNHLRRNIHADGRLEATRNSLCRRDVPTVCSGKRAGARSS